MIFGYTYPILDVFWSMLVFFGFVLWIYLLFMIFADLFRDAEESGWAKGLWTLGLLFFPLVGVLAYLIARGSGMMERGATRARRQQAAMDEYIWRVANEPPPGADAAGPARTPTTPPASSDDASQPTQVP